MPHTAATAPSQSTLQRVAPWTTARRKRLPDVVSRWVFGRPLAPTAAEWERLQAALVQGDPAMDRLVDWLFEAGPRSAKPLFDQALHHGIASVPNPPAPLRDFFAHLETPPDWLQRELLEEGVKAAHIGGKVGFFVLRDLALMGGYAYFNSMNQTLAGSGSLRKDTALRLGETGKWLSDVTEPGGLERFGPGFITTVRVRLVHALVRRNLQNKPGWDTAKWGLPINQVDMTATYLAFGPVTLTGSRLFGVPVRSSQSRAFMHLWRYIGWLMGVDEPWLAQSETDGLRKLYHCFLTHRLPDDKIRQLGEALRAEPLNRYLPDLEQSPRLTALMRRFLYLQHISNSALILGWRQRRQLGMPLLALPWYPLLSAPFRFLQLGYFQLRGGQTLEAFSRRNRERQKRLLTQYFGKGDQDIIRPGQDHPAHLQS